MLWENQCACSPLHSYLEIACASCSLQPVLTGGAANPGCSLPSRSGVVMPGSDSAMWRNWHGDKITLVLFSDLQECKLADLIYLLTLADALTPPCNSAFCLSLTLHRAVHKPTTLVSGGASTPLSRRANPSAG